MFDESWRMTVDARPFAPLVVLLVTGLCIALHRMYKGNLAWNPGVVLCMPLLFFVMVAPKLGAVGFGLYLAYLLVIRWTRPAEERCKWDTPASRAMALAMKDPDAVIVFEGLADAFERQGRYPEALDTLRRWQARQPENRELKRRIQRVKRFMGPMG